MTASLGDLADDLLEVTDPHARQRARAFAAALLDAHGAALARLLELIGEHGGDAAPGVLLAIVEDPVVASLLVLHDLHPVSVEDRVAAAVEEARDQLGPLASAVQLVAVEGDTVHVAVSGPASSPQARLGIESVLSRTLRARAPDVDHLVLVGEADQIPATRTRLPLLTT